MRVDKILHINIRKDQRTVAKRNVAGTRTSVYQAMSRIMDLPDGYDTEDENGRAWGPGGLVPNPGMEEDDWGAEALANRKVIARACRRLGREDRGLLFDHAGGMLARGKRKMEEMEGEDRMLSGGRADERTGPAERRIRGVAYETVPTVPTSEARMDEDDSMDDQDGGDDSGMDDQADISHLQSDEFDSDSSIEGISGMQKSSHTWTGPVGAQRRREDAEWRDIYAPSSSLHVR